MKQGMKPVRVELSREAWMDVIEALLQWSYHLETIRTKDNRDDYQYPYPKAIAHAVRIRVRLHDAAETADAETAIAVELDRDHWLKAIKGLHERAHPEYLAYRRIAQSIGIQLGLWHIQRGVAA